jgi:hypothetical protein
MCCICIKASSLIAASVVGMALFTKVHGDDLTGMPYDDPKELIPACSSPSSPGAVGIISFQPMPGWSHGVLPALPYQLTPMGKKPVVATASVAKPSLAPPADASHPATTDDSTTKAKPSPAPENPALMAVSPFLQWIKANPQAAAVQAREQANSYHASSGTEGSPSGPGASNATISTPTSPSQNAYWLPPLIDTPTITAGSVGGSSAAIYSTPQR